MVPCVSLPLREEDRGRFLVFHYERKVGDGSLCLITRGR